jgi:hypothetical protein
MAARNRDARYFCGPAPCLVKRDGQNPVRMHCMHSCAPPTPVRKNYLARPKGSHRARLILDVPEQCCGVCLPSPTWTGSASCSLASTISRSAIARRHCTQPRLTSISGPLYGTKEFPVATIRARAILRPTPATPSHCPLAYRLRKLRELQDPGSGRPVGCTPPRWASRLA